MVALEILMHLKQIASPGGLVKEWLELKKQQVSYRKQEHKCAQHQQSSRGLKKRMGMPYIPIIIWMKDFKKIIAT